MIQVLDKHKDMYFNTKYGSAGTLGIPNLWLDAISPLLNMGLLLVTLLTWIFTGEVYSSITGIAIYLVISLAISVVGISLEAKPQKRSYLAIPLLIFYNTFLDGIRIMSLTEEVISTIMEWEKPKR